MNPETMLAKIQAELPGQVLEAALGAPRRIQVKAEPGQLNTVLAHLKQTFGLTHLGTISGNDLGENFEIVYHLSNDVATVNVRILTPRANPRIPSVCAVIPGAILYERELQDMFGLVVENIPDPRPLLLADDWPAGEYPLRKDWTFTRPVEVIPGGA
jgi:Ni,Fe-hydrogenase III component G